MDLNFGIDVRPDPLCTTDISIGIFWRSQWRPCSSGNTGSDRDHPGARSWCVSRAIRTYVFTYSYYSV